MAYTYLDNYLEDRTKCAEESATAPFKEIFSQSLVRHETLRKVIDEFSSQPEHELLSMGVSQFARSLIQCQIGQYEYSMIALRQAIEIFLNGLYFSLNEILLLGWLDSKGDLLWAKIVDDEIGLFSTNTIATLCEPLQAESASYLSIARSLYRETSGYVHMSKNADKPHVDSHSLERISDWHTKFQDATYLLVSMWYVRYSRRIDATMNARLTEKLVDICGTHSPVYKFATTRIFNYA